MGASKLPPGLYVVATPIGNLADITLRAIETLSDCDVIACEDSRQVAKLLRRYDIRTPTIAYHEHSSEKTREGILARVRSGARVALVSDAGTPLISDPGYKLVRAAADENLHVSALPGPSAPIMALTLSGLPTDRFLFEGFLPPRPAARRASLHALALIPATLIFFESPRRLAAALSDMTAMLGDRPAIVARELSKLYEEVRRGSLSELTACYEGAGPPKGELVVVVGPPEKGQADAERAQAELDTLLRAALDSMRLKEAVAQVTAQTGLPRKQVYARALTLAEDK